MATWGYLRNDMQALPLISGRTHRIGRRPDCDLSLKSRSVSGDHAEIDVNDKQAVLRDLASLNGCFINNVRLKGQREVLMHGDNVRFGFDSRIWIVEAMSAKEQASPRKRAGEGWNYSAEGAGVSEQRRKPKPPPPQLPSGAVPIPGFFDRPTALERPLRFGGDDAPFPPEEELRTSRSNAAGLQEDEPEPEPPQPEPWRDEMAALQAKLAELQAETAAARQAERSQLEQADQDWRAEAAALQRQLMELREGSMSPPPRGYEDDEASSLAAKSAAADTYISSYGDEASIAQSSVFPASEALESEALGSEALEPEAPFEPPAPPAPASAPAALAPAVAPAADEPRLP
ncbi:hypothetical protein Ctob_016472, partial [Chrysochromulina tobinii]